MRKSLFIPAALIAALCSCGSGGDKSNSEQDTTTKAADTAKKAAPPAVVIAPLPDVPAGAKVFFKNLKDGATVKSPLKVEMGVSGIKLDTAGPVVAGSGHHHLLIDAGDSLAAGTVVPKDSTHLHFGKAQQDATITLTPGKHKLTLQFADGIHRSYGGALAKSITVTAK